MSRESRFDGVDVEIRSNGKVLLEVIDSTVVLRVQPTHSLRILAKGGVGNPLLDLPARDVGGANLRLTRGVELEARYQGEPAALLFHFPNVASRNALFATLSEWRPQKLSAEQDVTVSSMLSSVRSLYATTDRLLKELRAEEGRINPSHAQPLPVVGGQDRLAVVADELHEIQLRRTMRSAALRADVAVSKRVISGCPKCFKTVGHLPDCPARYLRCTQCGVELPAATMESHDCRARRPSSARRDRSPKAVPDRCPHCHKPAPASHVSKCAHRLVKCSQCGSSIKAKDAAQHVSQCPAVKELRNKSPSTRFRPRDA